MSKLETQRMCVHSLAPAVFFLARGSLCPVPFQWPAMSHTLLSEQRSGLGHTHKHTYVWLYVSVLKSVTARANSDTASKESVEDRPV